MKIKDTADLANILGMAFAGYASRVARGRDSKVFAPFIDGVDFIEVKLYLNNNGEIQIETLKCEPEPIVEAPLIVESPVLEEKPNEELVTEVTEEQPKPKNKRKKTE